MLDWMDVTSLSFNSLLLLERIQLSWLPGWSSFPRSALGIALHANPAVEWYLRNKAPEISGWIDACLQEAPASSTPEEVRSAEILIMRVLNDLLIYVLDPDIYDRQPFMSWNPTELTSLVDFSDKTVIDVGSGTGKQVFIAAPKARSVFAVEPVENLRRYIRQKASEFGYANVFPAEGSITAIPFPDHFADVLTCGHVFGDQPDAELTEMQRVVKPGGILILIPGATPSETASHAFLAAHGFAWQDFIEPPAGIVRKYWKTLRS